MAKKSKPTIIIDTREQTPFTFDGSGFKTVRRNLKTGDYTIKGMESIICFERKGTLDEVYGNLCTDAKERARQLDVFERMQQFPLRFLLVEATVSDLMKFDPAYVSAKVDNAGKELRQQLFHISTYYSLPILYVGKRSGRSLRFFWELVEYYWDKWCTGQLEEEGALDNDLRQ